MTEEPLVSVIVPVYNVEQYLPKCIESITSQTYKNLEIILIDDGSTDSSGKICDEEEKEDSRIKVFHKENGGLSDARNYGLDRAKGNWITFIDSDDFVTEDYVNYLLGLALTHRTKIAAGSHTIFYESGKSNYKGLGRDTENTFSQEKALEHILLDDGLDLSSWAKIYSADLFKEIRFPKGLAFEDTATTYRLFFLCDSVAQGGKSIYNYRIRANSITTAGSFQKKIQLIDNTKKMCREVTEKFPGLKNAAGRRLIWAYFSTLNQLEKCPDKKNYQPEEKEIVSYILENKKAILHGREYSKRDKIAALTLSMGLPVYNLLWKLYSRFSKQ